MTKKKKILLTFDSASMFFLSNLHLYEELDVVLQSETLEVPDKSKNERRAAAQRGKCHSAISRKLKQHSLLTVAGETWAESGSARLLSDWWDNNTELQGSLLELAKKKERLLSAEKGICQRYSL